MTHLRTGCRGDSGRSVSGVSIESESVCGGGRQAVAERRRRTNEQRTCNCSSGRAAPNRNRSIARIQSNSTRHSTPLHATLRYSCSAPAAVATLTRHRHALSASPCRCPEPATAAAAPRPARLPCTPPSSSSVCASWRRWPQRAPRGTSSTAKRTTSTSRRQSSRCRAKVRQQSRSNLAQRSLHRHLRPHRRLHACDPVLHPPLAAALTSLSLSVSSVSSSTHLLQWTS